MEKKIVVTDKQKQFFKEEGYLIIDKVIESIDLQGVIDELNAEIGIRANSLFKSGELSDKYENEPFEKRLAKISSQTPKLAVSIWNGILHGPAIFELITNRKLLDVAEAFCGEEVIASSVYRLRPKIPNFGYGEVPWHQDSGYFEPFCDDALVMTMWIPLVDANADNGCLYVIPGSHKGDVVEHVMHETGKYLAVKDELLPKENWVECPVPKGGVLLLSNKVIHASFKNTTDSVRWSMDLRYQSADLPTNANITRFEGDQKENKKAGVPAACYPPDADFLVRSKKRKNEIIKSYEEFKHLRENFTGSPVTNRFNVTWKEMMVSDVKAK
ncbi:phytanoyl-CoA dioxygenase family protein [Carboxylicivirga sediminis]|uniref:Phytanoyl-CoA dioxygenase family protein n=1 Tax=Carboxylicivirga sediminis TaxID=2006564 RepID=A0A941IXV2_9BACT|nr:phytanoyl-CoA dioxygenase family protein [Carboxylicivirga sediminis]MBR8535844.1 phytanoyl-CoA dioxygenase family protein [Carboxylicivirga sediminis]